MSALTRRLPYLVPLAGFAGLAIWFTLTLFAPEKLDANRRPGLAADAVTEMPDFAPIPVLGGAEGEMFARSDIDLTQAPLLVNLFASWCLPCKAEHPNLEKIADEGTPIYAIAWKDAPDATQKWLEEMGNPFTLVAADINGRAGIDFGLNGVPETYVIDHLGRVRHRFRTPILDETQMAELRAILAGLQAEADAQ